MTHRIGIIVYSGFQLLDAAGAMSVFEGAIALGDSCLYEIMIISADGGIVESSGKALVRTVGFEYTAEFDTLLICGGIGAVAAKPDSRICDYVQTHNRRGARIASICTGAFILADTNLLDGRRATTHWRFARDLARQFPRVTVEADKIWTRDGTVWTSAGVSSGIDLTLALVEADLGEAAAKKIARELVVYYRRPGGQSQYSALLDTAPPTGRFSALLSWVRENLTDRLDVEQLAHQVAMSPRNFSRAFLREVGITPARAVAGLRVEAARGWVVSTTLPFSQIADLAGFRTAERMRLAFVRCYGLPPQAMRRIDG